MYGTFSVCWSYCRTAGHLLANNPNLQHALYDAQIVHFHPSLKVSNSQTHGGIPRPPPKYQFKRSFKSSHQQRSHTPRPQLLVALRNIRSYKIVTFEGLTPQAFGGYSSLEAQAKFVRRIAQYPSIWCCIKADPGHIWCDVMLIYALHFFFSATLVSSTSTMPFGRHRGGPGPHMVRHESKQPIAVRSLQSPEASILKTKIARHAAMKWACDIRYRCTLTIAILCIIHCRYDMLVR